MPITTIDTTGLSPNLIGNSSSLTGPLGIGPSNTGLTVASDGQVGLRNNTMIVGATTSTITSPVFQTSGVHYPAGELMTEWYNILHCTNDTLDSASWIHIRTPIPADALAGIGYQVYMMEVKGHHTYGGENAGQWQAIINTTAQGDGNSFTSVVRWNQGTYSPFIYRSNNTYGGFRRMCFSMQKSGCCCLGWLWVRFNINNQYRDSFPWGKIGTNSQSTPAF
jgi:hypothetical protein